MTSGGEEPSNPLLVEWMASFELGDDVGAIRQNAIARYAFAIPTDASMRVVAGAAPGGIVEIGAGTGYWARAAASVGIDVVAIDPHPAPSADSRWFAGTPPWHPVLTADHTAVADFADRTLLLVWPTKNEAWPVETLDLYHRAGGACVVYVGEPPGGKTGDDAFHARLGEISTCQHCFLGAVSSACTCDYEPQWRQSAWVELPHWPGCHDDLYVYLRKPERCRRWLRSRSKP